MEKKTKKTGTEGLPYEKFLQKGAESLTDAELLAILLRTGPPVGMDASREQRDCPALALAEQVLRLPCGAKSGLAGLAQLSPAQLLKVKGIGEVKAVRICCVAELARRMALANRSSLRAFPDPQSAADYCRPLLEAEGGSVERAVLLLLDGKGRLVREKVLSVGTVNAALVSPREIFLQALQAGAVHFILLHNHPSGDPSPSGEDKEVTKRLSLLGEMMQLCLTDHIIVAGQQYYSFREAGLL
ncbi:MAG: DNA repair protein RadC [Eubacteriales bacterium]|nr:DNA repair protein RadC [Eubacteriales bacterium]